MSNDIEQNLPPNIDANISTLAEDFRQEPEAPKRKRGRRSKAQIEADNAQATAAAFEVSANTIAMSVIVIVNLLEETNQWSEATEKELEALNEATLNWLKIRAGWFAMLAPEIGLLMAWGGYVIPRIRQKKKETQTETQTPDLSQSQV